LSAIFGVGMLLIDGCGDVIALKV